uniref:Uncharacterized protein n=1 Tax=Cannabis sativa TaxID=3483 RepID=A0A803QKH1_CANSA
MRRSKAKLMSNNMIAKLPNKYGIGDFHTFVVVLITTADVGDVVSSLPPITFKSLMRKKEARKLDIEIFSFMALTLDLPLNQKVDEKQDDFLDSRSKLEVDPVIERKQSLRNKSRVVEVNEVENSRKPNFQSNAKDSCTNFTTNQVRTPSSKLEYGETLKYVEQLVAEVDLDEVESEASLWRNSVLCVVLGPSHNVSNCARDKGIVWMKKNPDRGKDKVNEHKQNCEIDNMPRKQVIVEEDKEAKVKDDTEPKQVESGSCALMIIFTHGSESSSFKSNMAPLCFRTKLSGGRLSSKMVKLLSRRVFFREGHFRDLSAHLRRCNHQRCALHGVGLLGAHGFLSLVLPRPPRHPLEHLMGDMVLSVIGNIVPTISSR